MLTLISKPCFKKCFNNFFLRNMNSTLFLISKCSLNSLSRVITIKNKYAQRRRTKWIMECCLNKFKQIPVRSLVTRPTLIRSNVINSTHRKFIIISYTVNLLINNYKTLFFIKFYTFVSLIKSIKWRTAFLILKFLVFCFDCTTVC